MACSTSITAPSSVSSIRAFRHRPASTSSAGKSRKTSSISTATASPSAFLPRAGKPRPTARPLPSNCARASRGTTASRSRQRTSNSPPCRCGRRFSIMGRRCNCSLRPSIRPMRRRRCSATSGRCRSTCCCGRCRIWVTSRPSISMNPATSGRTRIIWLPSARDRSSSSNTNAGSMSLPIATPTTGGRTRPISTASSGRLSPIAPPRPRRWKPATWTIARSPA